MIYVGGKTKWLSSDRLVRCRGKLAAEKERVIELPFGFLFRGPTAGQGWRRSSNEDVSYEDFNKHQEHQAEDLYRKRMND